jgi:hypothetical protein
MRQARESQRSLDRFLSCYLPALLVLVMVGGGCVGRAPPREDPVSGLSFGSARVERDFSGGIKNQGLVLATVISRNSKSAVEYLDESRATNTDWAGRSSGAVADLDAVPLIEGMRELVDRSFARVVRVSSPREAIAAGADLIGVIDLYVEIGNASFETTKVELGLIFISLDGQPIGTVRGVGTAKVPFPASNHGFKEAANEALVSFASALAQSE